jgi:hypothetical protein
MDELSERGRAVLGRLTHGLEPERGQAAVAWARIEAEIERRSESAASRFARRGRRGMRFAITWVCRSWTPIAIVGIVAMALGPVVRGDVGGTAHLEIARSLIEQGEHLRAYNVLVDHARMYKSKSGAEERMELALAALCGLEMHERAEDDLRRYLELNPASIHADRRGNVCSK